MSENPDILAVERAIDADQLQRHDDSWAEQLDAAYKRVVEAEAERDELRESLAEHTKCFDAVFALAERDQSNALIVALRDVLKRIYDESQTDCSAIESLAVCATLALGALDITEESQS
jgi:hypothetical protein